VKVHPQSKTNIFFGGLVVILIFIVTSSIAFLTISNLEIGKIEQNKVLDAFDERITGYEVFPRITISNKLYLTTLDYWSECVIIGHAFSSGDYPFINRPAGKFFTQNICDDVKGSMKSDLSSDSQKYYNYPQYIHGDAAVVKVVLKLTTLLNGKIILTVLLITLMLYIIYELFKSLKIIALMYFVYFFMLTDLVFQGFSLAHGIGSFWALSIIMFLYKYILQAGKLYYAYSIIGGSGYAILSGMHNPIQYIGLVAMISFIGLYKVSVDFRDALAKSFYVAFFWGIGGISTIISHWLLISKFSDSGSIGKALNSGFTGRFGINPFDSVYIFFGLLRVHIFQFSLTMFGLLFMLFIYGYVSKDTFKTEKLPFRYYIFIFFPTLLVVLWFLLMTGHIGHGWTINLLFTSILNLVSGTYFLKQKSMINYQGIRL
jgi:hypothetical protein